MTIVRIKLKHLADQEQAFSWSSALCKEWMLEAPDEAAVLYVGVAGFTEPRIIGAGW